MKPIQIIVAAGVLATCLPAMALNKCTSAEGKISYQEQPCTPAQRAAVVPLPPTQAELDAKAIEKAKLEVAQREKARQENQAAMKERDRREQQELIQKSAQETDRKWKQAEAACGGRIVEAPAVGMTEDFFRRCTATGVLGRFSVNETQTALGNTKQYVFPDVTASFGVRFVYVRNGLVNAIQR